jgi:hypothetical protein
MILPNTLVLRLVDDVHSYVSADANHPSNQMIANRECIGSWEEFTVVQVGDSSVYAVRAAAGGFVQVHGDNKLYPDGNDSTDPRCQFQVMQAARGGSQNVTLKSMHNQMYWSVRENDQKWLECTMEKPESWETFLYRGIQG